MLVCEKLLHFDMVAFQILSKRGAKMIVKIVLGKNELPDIIKDFLQHAELLHTLVEKAIWEVVEDIKLMLYDRDNESSVAQVVLANVPANLASSSQLAGRREIELTESSQC